MIIQVIHNPTAGDGSHSKRKILAAIPVQGNIIRYVSTNDENWSHSLNDKPELIIVAGGDGTFQKVAEFLIQNGYKDIPIKLLPVGTANNISKTLNFHTSLNNAGKDNVLNFSTGTIKGISKKNYFFESVGFGIIPRLFAQKKNSDKKHSSKKAIKNSLKEIPAILADMKPKKARIKVNGFTIKGTFYLIEILNIKYVGPNLSLTTNGNPEDNYFELILIPESKKEQFHQYLIDIIQEKNSTFNLNNFATIINTKKVKIKWKDDSLHIDDNLITDYNGDKISVKINPESLYVLPTDDNKN